MVSLPRQLPEPTRKHMADTTPGDPVAKQERQNHPVGTSAAVPTPHVIVSDDEEDNKPLFANFGKTFKKVASAVARTAASAAEMLKDEEMRKYGYHIYVATFVCVGACDTTYSGATPFQRPTGGVPMSLQSVPDSCSKRSATPSTVPPNPSKGCCQVYSSALQMLDYAHA